jgi:hypothetical protein
VPDALMVERGTFGGIRLFSSIDLTVAFDRAMA